MAIYDPQIEDEEERKRKLEQLRNWRSPAGSSVPDPGSYARPLVSLTADTDVQSPTGQRQWSPTVAPVDRQAPQRGYDPRFDDPDYGKKKKDTPDTGRERATFERPTRDRGQELLGPSRSSSAYDPLSSAPEPQEDTPWWNPFAGRKRDDDDEDKKRFPGQRFLDAAAGMIAPSLTWQEQSMEKMMPGSQPYLGAYGDATNPAIDLWGEKWQERREDDRVGTYDGPSMSEAWREAPTVSEYVTGEDAGGVWDYMPQEYAMKGAAALGAGARQLAGRLPEEGPVSGAIEMTYDLLGQALDAATIPGQSVQAIIDPVTGITFGESASAAGEAALNTLIASRNPDNEQPVTRFVNEYQRLLEEKAAIRGDWREMTPEEKKAWMTGQMTAFSGTSDKVANSILTQDEQVEALEQMAMEANMSGNPSLAAKFGSQAEELRNKTAKDFVDENTRLGPQMLGEMLFDPLMLADAYTAIARLGPVARRVDKALGVLDNMDANTAANVQELGKYVDEVFKEGGGKPGNFVKRIFDTSADGRAERDRGIVENALMNLFKQTDDKAMAREVLDAVANNPTKAAEVLAGQGKGTASIADKDNLDAMKNLLPWLRSKMDGIKSVQGEGKLNLADLQTELFNILDEGARAFHGGRMEVPVLTPVSDFFRRQMSSRFLNLNFRQRINNALSAVGGSVMDNQLNLRPMDDIKGNLMAKFGGVIPDVRVSEAVGDLEKATKGTGGGAEGLYGGGGFIDQIVKKVPGLNEAFYTKSGKPRWNRDEEVLYTRAFESQFRQQFNNLWENVARSDVEQVLAQSGIDARTARRVRDAVYEAGVQGSKEDVLKILDGIVADEESLFSLTNMGLESDALGSNQRYRDLRQIFTDTKSGRLSPEDATTAIDDIFDAETRETADIFSRAGGTGPERRYWSATDDLRDGAKAGDLVEAAAKQSGNAPAGRQARNELVDFIQSQSKAYQQQLVETMQGAGTWTRQTMDVFNDVWADVQQAKQKARILQGKAYQAYASGAKTWDNYLADARQAWDGAFRSIGDRLDQAPVAMADARNGTYTRKYDNILDLLDRVTAEAPDELRKIAAEGTTGEAIKANRALVDQHAANAYNSASQYGMDMNAIDILASAEDDVMMAGMKAEADSREAEALFSAGQITRDEMEKRKRAIWNGWERGSAQRYDAATKDIKGVSGVETAPPTMEDLRRLAGEAGVGTATEAGTPIPDDTWLLSDINKRLKTKFKSLDEMGEADLRRAEEAYTSARQKPATAKVDEQGFYYYDEDIVPIDQAYDANTRRSFAQGGATPPTVSDIAQYRYKQVREARAAVKQRLVEIISEGVDPVQRTGITPDQKRIIAKTIQALMPEFDNIAYAAGKAAKAGADFTMLNYNNKRGGDEILAIVSPYHYWYTRSIGTWLERMAAHPYMVASYERHRNAKEVAAEQRNEPARFQKKVLVPGGENLTPDGGPLYFRDVWDYLIPIDQLFGGNDFANPDEANSFVGKGIENAATMGFNTFPIVGNLVAVAEGRGKEVDWGNTLYPYHPINDTIRAITGRSIWKPLDRPWQEGNDSKALDMMVTNGTMDNKTAGFAKVIIANEANGRDPMAGVPEWAQEDAQEAVTAARKQASSDAALMSGSNWAGVGVARFRPEEQESIEVRQEYRDAGYSPSRNPAGSKAARDEIREKYPWIESWWKTGNMWPGQIENTDDFAAETQAGYYWDEYIAISEQETEAVAKYINDNPSASPDEVREFRSTYREQKDALVERYPLMADYEAQRKDRTKSYMNPFEKATQQVIDILRYQPPGKPEWPGEDADDATKQKYYKAKGLWDEKRLDYIDRVMTQMADMDNAGASDADKEIVAQIVTSRYAPDLLRGYSLRYASPEEVVWSEQWDLQDAYKGQDYDRWAAEKQERLDRVTITLGPQVAKDMTAYLDLPKGEERWSYMDEHPKVKEALALAFDPEAHAQAKEMFGDDIYDIAAAWPGSKKKDPQAWDKWAKSVGEDGVDRFYTWYGWDKERQEQAQGSDREGFTPAPQWIDNAQTGDDIRNKGRVPIGYEMQGQPVITDAEGNTRPAGNFPVRERAEYERDFLEVNPLRGYPAKYGDTESGVTPETAGITKPSQYNPVPGYNALPDVTPDELAGLSENKSLPPELQEILEAAQAAAYAAAGGGEGEAVAPGGGGDGGYGYGGGGGGWGGGYGGGSRYLADPYLQRLLAWRRDDWRPYYDRAAAARRVASVGPQNVRSWRRRV